MTTQVILPKQDPLEKGGQCRRGTTAGLVVIGYGEEIYPFDDVAPTWQFGWIAIDLGGQHCRSCLDIAFLERAASDADTLPFHYAKKVPSGIDS